MTQIDDDASTTTLATTIATEQEHQLVELRAFQRRLLRAVPDELFAGAGWRAMPGPLPATLAAVDAEILLRTDARDCLTDHAKTYLQDRTIGTTAVWARGAIGELDGRRFGSAKAALEDRLQRPIPEAEDDASGSLNSSLLQFLVLAALADLLADDGYEDPRLSTE